MNVNLVERVDGRKAVTEIKVNYKSNHLHAQGISATRATFTNTIQENNLAPKIKY